MSKTPLISFIITHPHVLLQMDFEREIFMIPDRMMAETMEKNGDTLSFIVKTPSPLYEGKFFVHESRFYALETFTRIDDHSTDDKVYKITGLDTGILYTKEDKNPLCTPQDTFILEPGDIPNYKGKDPIETTIGIFIANYLFFVYPFGDTIDYLNEEFTSSKMEKKIVSPLLTGRISTRDVKDKYINTVFLFGQSTEMISPNISEKTITIPKEIHDLREKLVAENKEELEAGNASVMSDIEQQLITAYKEYLKGDSSMDFLLKNKYFNVTLKKLFLTQGMTEVFGSPGKFKFIDNPMGKGWKIKDLPYIFDEVRQGSYSRAVETADGGVIAKLILRVFQDTRLSIPDCGTTKGEHVHGDAVKLKDFLWNYVINKDGTTTVLTEDNINSFTDKDIEIRTPGYCKATEGFCEKCFGRLFEIIGQKAFAPVANDFARNQTTLSLKKMHGSSHTTVDISDINKYLAN